MRCSKPGLLGAVWTASRKQDVASEWLKTAQNGSLSGGLLSHFARSEGDRERGFFGTGGTEVANAQTTDMPSLVSADSACPQPTSGSGSRVSDRPSDRGIPSAHWASTGGYG